ncbi:hypothetical protein C3B44_07005 [Corynebacterium yudongzhengii]|uniref:SWIM-type domain-containing protein n=1 Tax=Corynebacterium yudongzhengii TaxID=2080740 RepID=A0A2U1T9I0_9CORY|nr:SWIM zinc finger family protein [Corynebacterium yudongzhengii]AWB82138.1 hypothetical protein C3B44_07005 [Corynebacterium yudongzhengii]PWC02642.1 hypothetical protein DF222_01475 [Corynebacterium yudongzhengii]
MAEKNAPRKRVQHDNVIYANFGARQRVESSQDLPERRVDRQVSPAAARVINAVVPHADQGRRTRGRDYARNGNVVEIQENKGAIHAQVAGSQLAPFNVTMWLPHRAHEDIEAAVQELNRIPNGLQRAQRGQLDGQILDELFAQESELRFTCDCPDNHRVCKHIVAVADRVAARIDSDPGLIFRVRGFNLSSIARRLERSVEHRTTQTPVHSDPDFWDGGKLPDLPEPKVAPALDDSDSDQLQKAMRMISYTNIDQLRAVSDIEDLYDYLTH